MANYTKVFNNPYPSGWENLPSENTPITAEALQEHTDAISHIEDYLNDNPIKDATDVSWNQIQTSGDKIAEITIDGQKQNVFAPQQQGGASTWSEVAEKPFSTIGSGLRVQNDVLQSTDLSGTRAEFDAIKDSLPDGSAFDTTDENVGGGSFRKLDRSNVQIIQTSSAILNYTPQSDGVLDIISSTDTLSFVAISENGNIFGAIGNTNSFEVYKDKTYTTSDNVRYVRFTPYI